MNRQNPEKYTYTYSSSEREEVDSIRRKYQPGTGEKPEAGSREEKLARLKRLDKSVESLATAISLAAGILGLLLLGVGMCCVLKWAGAWFIPGVFLGLVGIAMMACTYLLYMYVADRRRRKIAPEVLSLTEELLAE